MNPRIFTRMSAMPIILTMFLLILVPTISISSASVSYFEISPENPVKGDIIKIKGEASSSERVPITLSFEKDLSVVDGKYEWGLSPVEIPEVENCFTVTATNVNKLYVSLTIFGRIKWFTIDSKEAENGIAKIIQPNAPAGTYDLLIHGDSGSNEVHIKVEAEAFLNADANGNFKYEYDTSSIPAGEFKVTVGSITRTVELTPSSNGEDGGGDGGGGSGGVAPETTPTPTLAIPENDTSNETTTPTPTLVPTPTSASTTTPQTTPIKTETGERTPGPTPQNETNQSEPPQKTTEPTSIPGFGFEAIGCIAIAALIMVIIKMKSAKVKMNLTDSTLRYHEKRYPDNRGESIYRKKIKTLMGDKNGNLGIGSTVGRI